MSITRRVPHTPGTFLPFIISNPLGSVVWWLIGVETKGLTCEWRP